MKSRHFLMGIALIVCLMTACNKNEPPVVDALADGEMAFGLSPESAFFNASIVETKAVAAIGIASFKAAVTQGAAGSETNAAPCWNNVVFTSDGADTPTYTASPKKYWPLTNPSYNVYAVAATSDAASATAAAAPDMVFDAAGTSISMAAGYDKDVICAYEPVADITYKAKNNLAFSHIFARISTVKVTALNPVAISNVTIQLVNTKTGGTYNLRTGNGQNDGTGWSSLLPADETYQTLYTNAGSIATGTSHTGSDNNYYVVPGTYSLRATWTASVDDYSQTFVNKTSVSPITIQGGKINSIEAMLTGNPTELTFSVSVSEWGSNVISGVEFPVVDAVDYALPGESSVDV